MRTLGLRRIAITVVAFPPAAFFSFVGFMKAFAPLAELRTHRAWTVHLPEPLGRLVGWSELLAAAALLAALAVIRISAWQRPIAVYFILNQAIAVAVHLAQGERAALRQNAVLAAAFALVFVLAGKAPAVPAHDLQSETL